MVGGRHNLAKAAFPAISRLTTVSNASRNITRVAGSASD
jgi:hypothetical protein